MLKRQRLARGFPTPGAARRSRDAQDFERAVTAYRFWYPTVSQEGSFTGLRELGIEDNRGFAIMALGPRHVLFTGNSDTPYGFGTLDLKDGPAVIELPAGPFIALAMDHHQRWIMDMGIPGPDAGRGGRHLVVPPGYRDAVPDGYHVGRSLSNEIMIGIRSMPQNGDVDAARNAIRHVKVYRLATAANPTLAEFTNVTDSALDCTSLRWEDNLHYWEKLHDVISTEPVVDEFRPMYGLLAALGVERDKPFVPDRRVKLILERAAKSGRDEMLVSAFDSSRPDRIVWPDRRWEWVALVPDSGDFETSNGLDVEARDRWFAQAVGASPAMFRRRVSSGSLYWLGHRDSSGEFLDGGKMYKLTVPLPVPAALFWSITAYDAKTRSQVQTEQDKAALRSLVELSPQKIGRERNCVELYFGPTPPPEGQPWIQTTTGNGWFSYFRLYGPQEPAFDGSWKPDDFEEVK